MDEQQHQQKPPPKTRTLGAQRDLSETLSKNQEHGGDAVRIDENSKYHAGGDLTILLDEVLNNTSRSIMIYDTFSDCFTDYEVQCLAEVMKHNKTIIAINMSGVAIGDGSISLLCDSLLQSNVQLLDFTNTPLDDDAGRSLWALAHNNKNVRTIIVSDTLVSEEIMDDIDLACVHNEHSYDLPDLVRIQPERQKYCVAHQFGACPNGALMCPLSHDLVGTLQEYECYDPNGPKKQTPYNARKDKIQKLEDVKAGATWSSAKVKTKGKKKKNKEKNKRRKARQEARARGEEISSTESESSEVSSSDDDGGTNGGYKICLDEVKLKLAEVACSNLSSTSGAVSDPQSVKKDNNNKQSVSPNNNKRVPNSTTVTPPPSVAAAAPTPVPQPAGSSYWIDWLPYISLGLCLAVIGGVVLTDGRGRKK